MKTQKMSTQTLVMGAVLTAMVIILQFISANFKVGIFATTVALVPIVIGAAICGKNMGAWLGFVFGVIVLISGDAAAFLAVNVPGTVITVLVKGTLCGFVAGCVYDLLKNKKKSLSVFAAGITCPVVNTGVFLIGCLLFFMPTIRQWAGSSAVGHYMIFALVGINFIIELATNLILSPVIVRLINIKNK